MGDEVSIGVGIVGCGSVGLRRARSLGTGRLVACADKVQELAVKLAQTERGAVAEGSWRAVVERPDVQIVIVATSNDVLAEISEAALQAGKHVLVEKPAARTTVEIDAVARAARAANRLVRVGFNHRYHPALMKAKDLCGEGAIGEPMLIRGRYGHGGRVGYDREWRADPERSGGGELIDQGVHVIDLARWFLGDFTEISGFASTYFWDMPVDDNAFLLLHTAERRSAHLHVSCTEWKNLFSFEIYGRHGKLHAEGLGGSYGVERLSYYRMLTEMGPPETTIWEYPRGDNSWELEIAEFIDEIHDGRQPKAGLPDARAALRVVEEVYRLSR